jgi:hypothetical protein
VCGARDVVHEDGNSKFVIAGARSSIRASDQPDAATDMIDETLSQM